MGLPAFGDCRLSASRIGALPSVRRHESNQRESWVRLVTTTPQPEPQPVPKTQSKPVHPLRVRDFRLLWAGAAVSLFGDQFYLVALPWLVLQITGSGLALGTVLMSAAVPRAVFMLVGGAVTDRFSPRRIMIGTASARTVLVAAVGVLVYWHVLHLWNLYVLSFAFGFADAFSFPAHQTLIPTIVTAEQLPAANAMVQSAVQASTIAGPWPAGYVIKRWSIAQAFFIDAVSFLFIIAALWRLPETRKPVAAQAARPKMWHSIVEGLRYVWHDPPIRALMLLSTALNFGVVGPLMVGLAVLAKMRMGTPTAYATLVMMMSIGALTGMLVSGTVGRPRHLGTALLALTVLMGLAMGSLGLLHRLVPAAAVLAGMGFGSGFIQVHLVSWFQKRVDRAVLGRVMSVLMFGAVGLIPVSYAVAGVLVQINLAVMFFASGALVLTVAVVAVATSGLKTIE